MDKNEIVDRLLESEKLDPAPEDEFDKETHRIDLFLRIKVGSRVTIQTPQGQERSGRAVMRGPHGWVLNMGGAHGTPGIATVKNLVRVAGSLKGESNMREEHGSGDWDFEEEKVDLSDGLSLPEAIKLFGLPPDTQSVDLSGKVRLKWTMNFDASTRGGIKSMYPSVPDQTIEFVLQYEDAAGETQDKDVTLEIKNCDTRLYCSDQFPSSLQMYPHELEIGAGPTFEAQFQMS